MIEEHLEFRIADVSGEWLRCECRVTTWPAHLRVQFAPELKLLSVTFGDGKGVEVRSDSDHARFLTIMRHDPRFEEHLDWFQIEECCEAAHAFGRGLHIGQEALV